jgi:hypothetical protein
MMVWISHKRKEMTTLEVTLELPDSLAKAAKDAGLLAPEALERIIAEALRRKNFDELLSVADRVEAAGISPMPPEELNAEIQAYRLERRRAGF